MNQTELLNVLKAMANEARLNILMMLSAPRIHFPAAQSDVEKDGVCLGLIAETLGYSQSTVSSYMTKLEHSGLVESTRQGQWTLYRLCPEKLSEFIQALQKSILS